MELTEKELLTEGGNLLSIQSESSTSVEGTLVALAQILGLPDSNQMELIDKSLSEIESMIGVFQGRLDKVQNLVDSVPGEEEMHKIENKLLEIRNIMKKFFPNAFDLDLNVAPVAATPASSSRLMTNKRTDVSKSEVK